MIAIPTANFARCGKDRACECSHSQIMVRDVIKSDYFLKEAEKRFQSQDPRLRRSAGND
jgi:hypothetical protein